MSNVITQEVTTEFPKELPDLGGNGTYQLKKHTAAIHIKNNISALQRKLWNVLLFNAFNELADPSVLAHSIRVRDLCAVAGFDSKNSPYLRKALEEMVSIKLSWNLLDDNGDSKEWGVSAALASAVIKDGICSYSYSHHLREKLHDPDVYAAVNLLVVSQINGSYALALYENCTRFRKVKQTPFMSLDLVRDLLGAGANGSYDDFKVFNRSVIQVALREINQVSDLTISVEPRRERRRVVALKFHIEENAQGSLPMEGSTVFNAELLAKLQEFYCLSETQSKTLLTNHSEDEIRTVMNYVAERYTAGKITAGKIAPYFLRVVEKGGYASLGKSQSKFDLEKKQRDAAAAKAKKAALDKLTAANQQAEQARLRVKEYLDGLSAVEQTKLRDLFVAHLEGSNNPFLLTTYRKSGLRVITTKKAYEAFVLEYLQKN